MMELDGKKRDQAEISVVLEKEEKESRCVVSLFKDVSDSQLINSYVETIHLPNALTVEN